MNHRNEDVHPQSYNCFYSAITSVLEEYYSENTQLIINNRWQLFYKLGEIYSDDYRYIGEYPLLYDQAHLILLNRLLGINIRIIQTKSAITKIKERIQNNGYVFVFTNRFCYDNKYHPKDDKCVTTICLDDDREDRFHYQTYDLDLASNQWVEKDVLFCSWKNASEFDFLNNAFIEMKWDKLNLNDEVIRLTYSNSLIDSLQNYLEGYQSKEYIYGNQALSYFANDIKEWNVKQHSKFVDGSMYINIISRQRQCLRKALRHFSQHDRLFDIKEKELCSIIELWDRLKMLMFLMGMRKQTDTVQCLSDQIRELQNREYSYAAYLYECMLKFTM